MTSAVRTNKPSQGFTLIEIVMVMAIAAVVMAGAISLIVFSSDERGLRNASGEIELLAKRARTIAILHQIPYALEFREGIVRLIPYAQAGQSSKRSVGRKQLAPDPVPADPGENRQYNLASGVTLTIRHWNSDKWLGTAKENVQVWRFDPDGLCEPLSIHLALGRSWVENSFHPLTAAISDSQNELR